MAEVAEDLTYLHFTATVDDTNLNDDLHYKQTVSLFNSLAIFLLSEIGLIQVYVGVLDVLNFYCSVKLYFKA